MAKHTVVVIFAKPYSDVVVGVHQIILFVVMNKVSLFSYSTGLCTRVCKITTYGDKVAFLHNSEIKRIYIFLYQMRCVMGTCLVLADS